MVIGTTDPNSNYLGEIENTLIKIEMRIILKIRKKFRNQDYYER